jgi:protein-disulfide isomerase
MREIWFAALAAAILVTAPAAAQPATGSALAVTAQDRVLGKADAPITIIEYASMSCPHCANFAGKVLPKLKEKWIDPGKAKLVLRDFPLDEPAMRAAMVARCAPPEKFYPLVDMMFETQDKWVVAPDWRVALERIVKLGGIGKKDFDSCVGNKKLEDQVAQSRLDAAQQLGVNSTPYFFINGKAFQGEPTLDAFDQALSQAAPKS